MYYILYTGKSISCAPRVKALYQHLTECNKSVRVGGIVKSKDLDDTLYDTSYVYEFSGRSSLLKITTFFLATLRFLLKSLAIQKNDTIYAINPISGIFAYIVFKIKGTQYIYESQEIFLGVDHDFYRGKWRFIWHRVEKKIINKAQYFVTTDEFRAKFLSRFYGIKRDKCTYIYNVPSIDNINIKDIRSNIAENYNFIFSYCGAVGPGRSIENIVRAFCKIDRDDILLIIAGYYDYTFKAKLDSISNKRSNIIFTGKVSNDSIQSYMKSSDFTFALYDKSCLNNRLNSPNKLFDAILNNVLVITTSTFLSKKLFSDNKMGVLVKENDVSNITAAIQKCLSREKGCEESNLIPDYTQEKAIPALCKRVMNV